MSRLYKKPYVPTGGNRRKGAVIDPSGNGYPYCYKYDAFFNPETMEFTSPKCIDPDCRMFCSRRPKKHRKNCNCWAWDDRPNPNYKDELESCYTYFEEE